MPSTPSELQPVHGRHVDLAELVGRSVQDAGARADAQQGRLLGHREGGRDRRLRGDHRRHGGDHDQGIERPVRRQLEERVGRGGGIGQQQRALAVVVGEQGREHHDQPGDADGIAAEMADVGVERLRTGERQRDRAQRHEGAGLVLHGEGEGMIGRQRHQHLGMLHDLARAQQEQDGEPDQHDRPEQMADAAGAVVLHGEQADQHGHGDRQDHRLEGGRRHVQALDGAQHRDGGRQQAVAVEQGGAQHAQDHVDVAPALGDAGLARYQRHQRQHAALAVIVGAHDHNDVFQGDDDQQRPGDQRQHAEHVVVRRLQAGEIAEAGLDGVERAGADVAEDDAERRQRQAGRPLPVGGPQSGHRTHT